MAGALAVLIIGACSSSASPSEEPTPKPTPTAEASQSGTLPSLAPGAGELEGILPVEVGGITLTYQYVTGYGGDSGAVIPELKDFLDRTGTRVEDVTVAFGVGVDQAAGGYLSIFATQVPGADEETLQDEFRTALEENTDNVLTETTVAGKDVLAVASAGQDPYGLVYVHDDILFLVRGSTELTEEAVSLLP